MFNIPWAVFIFRVLIRGFLGPDNFKGSSMKKSLKEAALNILRCKHVVKTFSACTQQMIFFFSVDSLEKEGFEISCLFSA